MKDKIAEILYESGWSDTYRVERVAKRLAQLFVETMAKGITEVIERLKDDD